MFRFPPCSISDFLNMPFENRERRIMSFAQFRPEKNHELQINLFKKLKQLDNPFYNSVKFVNKKINQI